MANRREFIKQFCATSLAFNGLLMLQSCSNGNGSAKHAGFGPVLSDNSNILNLPEGFSYKIIQQTGNLMNDGYLVPGRPDGMATFAHVGSQIIVVRNHELGYSSQSESPFSSDASLLSPSDVPKLYDSGSGALPCIGGTTNFVYDLNLETIVSSHLSLAGTDVNCAGGKTPWNTWLTCEESDNVTGGNYSKDHGYIFEVDATEVIGLQNAIPLKKMGRFNHEAATVDPDTGIVYLTEDKGDGLFYRFIPDTYGDLSSGILQALKIKNQINWLVKLYTVEWVTIDDYDALTKPTRTSGKKLGAKTFSRGEGIWWAKDSLYFSASTGGEAGVGQIWKYTPSQVEGEAAENNDPGLLQLFYESKSNDIMENNDNLTIAPWGDLIVCEDNDYGNATRRNRLIGVTSEGQAYIFAENAFNGSEFAGACFSPDGSTLFVNIQNPGYTLAIKGPWPVNT